MIKIFKSNNIKKLFNKNNYILMNKNILLTKIIMNMSYYIKNIYLLVINQKKKNLILHKLKINYNSKINNQMKK